MTQGVEMIGDSPEAGSLWIFCNIFRLSFRVNFLFSAGSVPANSSLHFNHSFESGRQDAQLCYYH